MASDKAMKAHDWAAIILLAIGGINWGLKLWNINLVEKIFGRGFAAKSIYALVGLAGLYTLFWLLWKLYKAID